MKTATELNTALMALKDLDSMLYNYLEKDIKAQGKVASTTRTLISQIELHRADIMTKLEELSK